MQTLIEIVTLIEVLREFEDDVAKCIRRKLRDWPLVGYSFADGFEHVRSEHWVRCAQKWENASARIKAGELDPRAWVFRQLYDTFSLIREQERSRLPPAERFGSWLNVAAGWTGPATKAERMELAEKLYEAMQQLSNDDRLIVELRIDDLNWTEIAQVLGLKDRKIAKLRYVEVIRRLKTML